MEGEDTKRLRTMWRSGQVGNTRTSSDETTTTRGIHRDKSAKCKPLSLRGESSRAASLRPSSSSKAWQLPSDSSSPVSPDLTRSSPRTLTIDSTRTPNPNGVQRHLSHSGPDNGTRSLLKFHNEETTRKPRQSQDTPPTPTPKSSLDSDRYAMRASTERPRSNRNANRKSITVIPESNSEWDISTALPTDAQARRRSTKSRTTTLLDDQELIPKTPDGMPSNNDEQSQELGDGRRHPLVDPRKMLQLMRKTRGYMQGSLYFRESIQQPWVQSPCYIDVESGSLCTHDSEKEETFCLMQDLRKCCAQAVLHSELKASVLHLSAMNGFDVLQIRPVDMRFLNAWFAALLCWGSVQLGQHLTDRREQQRPNLIRQISDFLPVVDSGPLSNPIRKVGNAVLVEIDESKLGFFNELVRPQKMTWTAVSCLLNAKGELRIMSKTLQFMASMNLAELPRSAIQRLGPSVLGADCVIAVYPQYAQSTTACSRLRPIYLSFESRELFEVWFVLLRAHAIPELYGTSRMQSAGSALEVGILPGLEPLATPMYFRLERSLHLRVNEAKLHMRDTIPAREIPSAYRVSDRIPTRHTSPSNYCVEILLDGQVKAKSTIKQGTAEPVWYEQFDFYDFATALSSIAIRLKKQEKHVSPEDVASMSAAPIPGIPTPEKQVQHRQKASGMESPPSIPFETHGEAMIETSMLSSGVDVESWHTLTDDFGNTVGKVSVKIRQEEDTVLMDREYDAIFDLLHNFSNALTLQIYERIPLELGRLSVCLLNIFQVSGQAADWLMALAEEEVDGVREQAVGRARFNHRLDSRDSHESLATIAAPHYREDMVRELNKTATQEANLLFRGNTLLSKALDYHMRRVGRTYLDDTIGALLRQIAANDIDCEVDPSRTPPGYDHQKAWKRLLNATSNIWERIRRSADHCPSELRTIFRHIRACANDRYGDYMRTVTYSSVSGFLFLRFFCAAVLNPHLFGLLNISPSGRAQRTFILVAKSLNGLASMTTFGSKEPWMSPMNTFLNNNRHTFKAFIDEVCGIRTDEPGDPIPTSYAAPIMIFQKLPTASREGFPSLPHLIDRARNLANLVDIWLEGLQEADKDSGTSHGAKLSNSLTGDLARFHDACLALRQRTRAAWHAADRSERMPSGLAHKWVATAERMEVAPEEFWGVEKAASSIVTPDMSVGKSPGSVAGSVASAKGEESRSEGSERRKRLSVKSPSRRRKQEKEREREKEKEREKEEKREREREKEKERERDKQGRRVERVDFGGRFDVTPPTRPMSTAPREYGPRPRTASQPLVKPVATAAQLSGGGAMTMTNNTPGVTLSSTATSEGEGDQSDEDGRSFVMRTMRDISGDNLPGIDRRTRDKLNDYALDSSTVREGSDAGSMRSGRERRWFGRRRKEEEGVTRESRRGSDGMDVRVGGRSGTMQYDQRKEAKDGRLSTMRHDPRYGGRSDGRSSTMRKDIGREAKEGRLSTMKHDPRKETREGRLSTMRY